MGMAFASAISPAMLVAVSLFLHTWTQESMGFCDAEADSRFDIDSAKGPIWIAKSLIDNFDDLRDFTIDQESMLEIHIPQWVAEKNGLDPYCEEI